MNFGTELAAGLAELRRHAISRMRATCVIERPGEDDTDENGDVTTPFTQIYPDPEWPDDHPHADGKCYTRYPGLAWEQTPEVAGATIVSSRLVVSIPHGVVARPGDVVTILSDPDNSQMIGTRLRVASIDDQSQATRQRLVVDDLQGPPGINSA